MLERASCVCYEVNVFPELRISIFPHVPNLKLELWQHLIVMEMQLWFKKSYVCMPNHNSGFWSFYI
jgi:hypothetical protein